MTEYIVAHKRFANTAQVAKAYKHSQTAILQLQKGVGEAASSFKIYILLLNRRSVSTFVSNSCQKFQSVLVMSQFLQLQEK